MDTVRVGRVTHRWSPAHPFEAQAEATENTAST